MNYTNHEHEGEWLPPSTFGGTFTRSCTICGLYETKPGTTFFVDPIVVGRLWFKRFMTSTKNTESF